MRKKILSVLLYLLALSIIVGYPSGCEAQKSQPNVDKNQSIITPHLISMDGREFDVPDSDIKENVKAALQNTIKDKSLTKDQIKDLAKKVGLLKETKTNPHLCFLDGDISYWFDQGLSPSRLQMEFVSRKVVLDAADRAKVIIDDQGKLSWAAQQIMSRVLKERAAQKEKISDQDGK